MIVQIGGQVLGVRDEKTKKDNKPYRVVELLQQGERGAEVVRVNLWNGHKEKVEVGKQATVTANVRAFSGSRGGVMLSADVY